MMDAGAAAAAAGAGDDASAENAVIELNVGGRVFATTRATLEGRWRSSSDDADVATSTFFTSLLSGRVPVLRDAQGRVFLDQSPEVFVSVLDVLRGAPVVVLADGVSIARLRHDLDYFGIPIERTRDVRFVGRDAAEQPLQQDVDDDAVTDATLYGVLDAAYRTWCERQGATLRMLRASIGAALFIRAESSTRRREPPGGPPDERPVCIQVYFREAPQAVMSAANLLPHALCPQYSEHVYMTNCTWGGAADDVVANAVAVYAGAEAWTALEASPSAVFLERYLRERNLHADVITNVETGDDPGTFLSVTWPAAQRGNIRGSDG